MDSEAKTGSTKKIILTILMIFIICLIWGSSLLPVTVSEDIDAFTAMLLGSGAAQGGAYVWSWIHFAEFFALGLIFTLYLRARPSDRRSRALALGGGGMFFSLMDETLQMVNGRAASVKDIWLDIAGFALGLLLLYLIGLWKDFFRMHKKK